MSYIFPTIERIEDVLPAIEGRDEFIVAEKDGYKVVNYVVAFEDTFPPVNTVRMANGDEQMRGEGSDPIFETKEDYHAALRRECRGLIFDSEGALISRRYHKFFNVNERDETQMSNIDWTRPHRILEKLDGSMISPILVRGNLRWTTKMGITDVAMQAEVHVAMRPVYVDFALQCIKDGFTPIFEWCSRASRIVLDYAEDQLVLTGVRVNRSGEYMDYRLMVGLAKYWHLPVVQAHEITEDLINTIAKWEGSEGVVVRFNDGHMVKVKAEWYVIRHKSKEAITREKNVIEYIVNDRVDDVLPFLQPEDQDRLKAFQREFWEGFDQVVNAYDKYWNMVQTAGLDRKRYALEWKPTIELQDQFAPVYVFGRFSGKDGRDLVLEHIRRNVGTQTKVNEVRGMWNGARWEYSFEGDA